MLIVADDERLIAASVRLAEQLLARADVVRTRAERARQRQVEAWWATRSAETS